MFHFKGVVDGSDRILITRAGAFWEHVNWDWPAGAVAINDAQWNPREKNYLTTTGLVAFLPEAYSLEAASLEIIEGRDVVALERTNNALIVYLNDTPAGAAMYEFKILFHPIAAKPAKTGTSSATLKIAAQIAQHAGPFPKQRAGSRTHDLLLRVLPEEGARARH